MPYRTAPEKPVEVREKLTPEEVVEAVLDYASEHKGIEIPQGFKAKHVYVVTPPIGSTHTAGTSGKYKPTRDGGYPVHVVWNEEGSS